MALTEYIILAKDPDKNWWIQVGEQSAHSAPAAVIAEAKHALKTGKGFNRAMVAVPARSWQPVEVEMEVEERIKLVGEDQPTAEEPD